MREADATLILASRSPQRRQILRTLGVDFTVDVAGVEEATDGDAIAVAVENARRKALAVAARAPAGAVVLGSDTVIAVPADAPPSADGLTAELGPWDELVAAGPCRAVGKPADAAEAAEMLRDWSGRAHHVVSAAAVVIAGSGGATVEFAGADASRVCFRSLDAADIGWYVGTEEWQERAGGYAIQLRGSLLVDGIVGDWWNVVGLPVALLAREVPRLLR
jgi:septum formation protein